MSATISVEAAQAKLPELIESLRPGDEIVLTQGQRAVAKLTYTPSFVQPRPGPGLCQGMLTIVADDEEHLEHFAEYMP